MQSSNEPGSRAESTEIGGHNDERGQDMRPVRWWLAQQWADVTGSIADQPLRDEIGVSGWQGLRKAMVDSLGVEITPEMSFVDLLVVPADFAARHAETTLTPAQIAAFADTHGLDYPDVIADRLAREHSLQAEHDRDRVRALFDGDPLPLTVTKLPPFPVHALPVTLADMATGVARELGVDPAMTAAFGLGAVSGALCGRVVVQVQGNWFENCVSYIAVVAESGDRKSPAFSAMLGRPLGSVERLLTDNCWESTYVVIDPDGPDGLPVATLDGMPEFVGPAPRLIASDATPEQLGVLMADNGERMIVADAEGDVFDMLAGRYSASPSMTLFLQSYSREYVRVDRVGRAPVSLDEPALTMCLGTQPSVWHEVMSNPRFAGKGFVARIEAAFPEPRKERTRRMAAMPQSERGDVGVPVDPQVVAEYRAMLTELATGLFDTATITAKLTEEAQMRMRRHTTEVDRRTLDDGDMGGQLARWGAKCSGRVVRRALHLHMAEHGIKGTRLLIERDTIERAIEIEEWFIANAKEAYGLADTGDDVNPEDLKAFVGWLVRKHRDAPYQPVPLSYISQNVNPKALRQKSRRDRAIEVLVDLKYLAHVKVGKMGTANAVCLNPAAADG
ncbi:YfjI family protein [Mycobacterium intracellulare]|uniref:YfjI family protein n=1 Tax=Mycobacterium intracellulare TaxID=1767 RepID=UPI0019153B04|nr:YfjI family protein [Mycobacterium intracellulare]MCA2356762.1 DUF3987 domain-containing protein [Mycobacterium intracellulare]MCA2367680.1 DUF3987 domain-containing protein [Mycobacterium intracellulare]